MNNMYTQEETHEITKTCWEQIRTLTPVNVLMSWGITQVAYTTYKDMPTLILVVNGFLHKGPVFISYNGLDDAYEVRTVKNHTKEVEVLKTAQEVFFEELGGVIDRMVEKDCTQEEYNKKVNEFLKS